MYLHIFGGCMKCFSYDMRLYIRDGHLFYSFTVAGACAWMLSITCRHEADQKRTIISSSPSPFPPSLDITHTPVVTTKALLSALFGWNEVRVTVGGPK